MTKRLNFYTIFRVNQDGSIEPLQIVRIGGTQLGPGVRLGKGVFLGGIDLTEYIGREFEAKTENGILIITGIYKNNEK